MKKHLIKILFLDYALSQEPKVIIHMHYNAGLIITDSFIF